ncbi:MAG: hypothetical protein JWL72_3401 [Ilumatobacteraceae bacterium]|nr:hypothetical protein [Ilumatobacteraceae bacterium]
MTSLEHLQVAIEEAFAFTSRETPPWPDPHPDHAAKPQEVYSRLTNPARWRTLRTRTDAWLIALTQFDLASVEPDAHIAWRSPPGPVITSAERVVPAAAGALELVIAHSRIGDVDDAGVVLGVGSPAECINWFPDCGCDACDSGSQNELDHLDNHLLGIVTGRFRRLTNRTQMITVINEDRWSASNLSAPIAGQVEKVLADARGWTELTGSSWLDTPA